MMIRAACLLPVVLVMVLGPEGMARAQRPGQPVPATAAAMSADASLVAAQEGWTVRIWERQSGKLITSFNNEPSFLRGAVSRGALVGISEEKPGAWRGARFEQRVKLRALPKVTTYGRVFVSNDGRLLGVLYPKAGDATDPDSFGVWSTKTGELCGSVSWDKGTRIHGVVFGRGDVIAAFGDEPGKRALLRLYQIGAKGPFKELLAWSSTTLQTVFSAAISDDGRRLALGADERILLWDLAGRGRRLIANAPTQEPRRFFPAQLQVPSVRILGAHQLAFSKDGKRLASLHGFGVVGIGLWELAPGKAQVLKPVAWLKRPAQEAGTLRQIAWDAAGKLWLITATYSPVVTVHVAQRDQFVKDRSLTP